VGAWVHEYCSYLHTDLKQAPADMWIAVASYMDSRSHSTMALQSCNAMQVLQWSPCMGAITHTYLPTSYLM
jgi:hypothetical protein